MSLNANAKSGVNCLGDAGELRIPPTHRKQRGAGIGVAAVMQEKGCQIGEGLKLRKFREGGFARVGAGPHLNAQGFEAFQFGDRLQE
jgi:hypothetical protein